MNRPWFSIQPQAIPVPHFEGENVPRLPCKSSFRLVPCPTLNSEVSRAEAREHRQAGICKEKLLLCLQLVGSSIRPVLHAILPNLVLVSLARLRRCRVRSFPRS